jgi:protein-tyrosine phosphatase
MEIPDSYLTTLHKIDTNLYLGGLLGASNPSLISRLHITSIVRLLNKDAMVNNHRNIRYLDLSIDDLPTVNIIRVVPDALRFISQELSSGGVVLIHCAAGVSRSASIAVAYFMAKYSLSYDQALARVRKGRACAYPNQGFERQLRSIGTSALRTYLTA